MSGFAPIKTVLYLKFMVKNLNSIIKNKEKQSSGDRKGRKSIADAQLSLSKSLISSYQIWVCRKISTTYF